MPWHAGHRKKLIADGACGRDQAHHPIGSSQLAHRIHTKHVVQTLHRRSHQECGGNLAHHPPHTQECRMSSGAPEQPKTQEHHDRSGLAPR